MFHSMSLKIRDNVQESGLYYLCISGFKLVVVGLGGKHLDLLRHLASFLFLS